MGNAWAKPKDAAVRIASLARACRSKTFTSMRWEVVMNRLRQREQSVLEQGREWTRRRLEPQWQAASDGLAAVCPQTGQGLRETRWRDLQLTTVAGGVKWHEVKSAVIYRLEQQVKKASGRGWLLEKDIVAWPPETAPVDFGAAVQAEARRRGLGRARYVYLVMDGAVWLWDLGGGPGFANAIKTLDSHQASQHLWAVGHALYGEGTASAKEWVQNSCRVCVTDRSRES